jgi:hypothetical protein
VSEVARCALGGIVGSMAMTGMRTFTVHAGLLREDPPRAILRQKARGLLRLVPRRRRRVVMETCHWAFGAAGGAAFGALPDGVRRRRWAGPAFGMLMWLGFEAGLAPLLGLKQAREVRPVERAVLAVDHALYGLVLSESPARQRG